MPYLTIVAPADHNWTALVPELSCIIAGKNREDTLRLARESIALALEDGPQPPRYTSALQLDDDQREDLPDPHEVVFLDPAPMNPVSAAIGAALERAGMTQAELGRRIGTSRSAVNRLVNPFYWGHSLDVLRRVADALEQDLNVSFTAKAS